MKIIEAMKKIKSNKEKIADLQLKIGNVSANTSIETPLYGALTPQHIKEWLQAVTDLTQDNVHLLVSISRTNLQTPVTIMLGDKSVTKSIAEWVWRRREYALLDQASWSKLTDRNIREGQIPSTTPGGAPVQVTIQRHYDPVLRDRMIALFKSEPHEIDAALEVINAVTDLQEA